MLGTNDNLCRLVAVLDGRVHLNTLRHLNLALGEPRRNDEPDDTLAIGLDANILLNLGKAESSADVVDYLAEQHSGPLILPHQALIEFWNNEVPAISGPSDRLRANFKALSNELKKLDPEYDHFSVQATRLLDEFSETYVGVVEGPTSKGLCTLLESLENKALTPQLPRCDFESIARRRKTLRIPPGFKDERDGDFYVWGEFLLGLLAAGDAGLSFPRAVLVTDDKKVDWSTKGTAHPSLCAEVEALTGAGFEIWTMKNLKQFVDKSIQQGNELTNTP